MRALEDLDDMRERQSRSLDAIHELMPALTNADGGPKWDSQSPTPTERDLRLAADLMMEPHEDILNDAEHRVSLRRTRTAIDREVDLHGGWTREAWDALRDEVESRMPAAPDDDLPAEDLRSAAILLELARSLPSDVG